MCEAGDRETFPRWLSSHMMMHRRTGAAGRLQSGSVMNYIDSVLHNLD